MKTHDINLRPSHAYPHTHTTHECTPHIHERERKESFFKPTPLLDPSASSTPNQRTSELMLGRWTKDQSTRLSSPRCPQADLSPPGLSHQRKTNEVSSCRKGCSANNLLSSVQGSPQFSCHFQAIPSWLISKCWTDNPSLFYLLILPG